jgi:phosphatidylglycerophosphatase A
MIKKFNLLFLSLFGIGKIKYAPGTIASLATCLVFIYLVHYLSILFIFFFTLLIFIYSFFAINNSYESYDSKDPKEIVIDEFVGQMLPLLAIPIYEILYPSSKIYYCIIAFVLFRFFDILKPFPISYVDKNTDGALGIMMDDVIAGFFAIIIMLLIFFFIGG